MPNTGGQMWYEIGLDDSQFDTTARRVKAQFGSIGRIAEKEGARIDNTFRNIGMGVATYFGGTQLLSFGKQIANVTGEFQQLDISLQTMLKSKPKADKLMREVVQAAATTPYELKDVGKGAKQLLAFQVPANQIIGTMRQLGDLAAGVNTPLNDLVSIYGKVKAKGKLQAEEMNLFLERGIPLISELADKYKVTEAAIYKMAEKGKIGFSDLQYVIDKLTKEGGMFFNLMEKQSKSIPGQISNLSDAIAQAMNEIGTANMDLITDTIGGAKWVVDHYQEIWKILKVLIATYGTYRAALIAISAAQRASIAMQQVQAWFQLARSIRTAKDAQIAFNLASKANPYVLLASVIAGVVTALIAFNDQTDKAAKLSAELADNIKTETDEATKLFDNLKKAKEGTNDRKKAIEEINSKYGSYLENMLTEKSNAEEIAKAYDKVTDAIARAQLAKTESKFLEEPKADLDEATADFWDEIADWGKELTKEQEGRFNSYVADIIKGIKAGESFNIKDIERAFDMARASQKYDSYEEYWHELRAGNEKAGKSALDVVGGWDYSGVDGMGKTLELLSRKLIKVKKDYEDFKKGFIGEDEQPKKDGSKGGNEAGNDVNDTDVKIDLEAIKKLQAQREAMAKEYELMQFDVEQARINAMENGVKKELAQNELNHKKRIAQINNQKAEILQMLQDIELLQWQTKGGKKEDFKSKTTELSPELNQIFIDQTIAAVAELEKANSDALKSLLSPSEQNKQDVSAQLTEIANAQKDKLEKLAKYEELKIRELKKQEQQYDVQTFNKKLGLIKEEAKAKKQAIINEANDALSQIPKQYLDEFFKDFDLSFSNLDHATLGQLNKLADKLTKLTINRKELIDLGLTEDQITRLESLLKSLKVEGLSNIKTAQTKELQSVFGEIGAAMSQATDEMTHSIGEMVTALSNVVTTLTDANASNFQKASGLIGLAITAGNYLSSLREQERSKEAENQIAANQAIASQLTMERKLNEIRRERREAEKNSSPFLSPNFKEEYEDALSLMKESEKALDKSISSLMDNAVFSAKGKAKRRLFGTKSGMYSFTIKQLLGDYAGPYTGDGASDLLRLLYGDIGSGIEDAINNGGVMDVLGAFLDPAGIFGGYASGKAQKNALGKLRDAFQDTFAAIGKTGTDIANMTTQEWLDFFVTMEEMGYVTDEGTKSMIENAKVAVEDYSRALEEMKKIIADIAGRLGTDLQGQLIEAFEKGEDAALAFKSTVNEVLKSIFMQNLESALFKKHFEKLQKEMSASMEGGDGDWSDDIGRFFDDVSPTLEKASEAMKAWDDAMEAAGYEGFKEDLTRTANRKGIAAASQDSVDEFNGRFTVIQSHTYSISEGVKLLTANSSKSLAHLAAIEQNTSRLAGIEKAIMTVKSNIEDINTRGISLR